MTTTPRQVGDEIERSLVGAQKALESAIRGVMKDAGQVARKELSVTATIVPGPDRIFSNFRRAGRLGVKVRHSPGSVTISPVGPWGIAERGRRASGGHPGTRAKQGKQSWSRGRDAALERIGREAPETILSEVEEAFGD